MIQKNNLTSFVEKYYLAGTIEAAILQIEDNTLKTKFASASKSLVGVVEMKDVSLEDAEIGVYYTGTLLKMLSILDNDIDVTLKYGKGEEENKVKTIKIEDKKNKKINYATSDLELIDRFDKKIKITEYEIKIDLNNELIENILKAVSAIQCNSITFMSSKNKLFIVFGYSKLNTNQIKFEIEAKELEDFEPISFNVIDFKNILLNNKKFNKTTFEISIKGIAKMHFESDDITSEYYLVKLQDAEE